MTGYKTGGMLYSLQAQILQASHLPRIRSRSDRNRVPYMGLEQLRIQRLKDISKQSGRSTKASRLKELKADLAIIQHRKELSFRHYKSRTKAGDMNGAKLSQQTYIYCCRLEEQLKRMIKQSTAVKAD